MNTSTISLHDFTKHLSTMSALEYLLEILPKCSKDGPWIAGGSLHRTYRNLQLQNSDVDVFFKDKEQMDAYVKEIITGENSRGKYKTKDYIVTEWHQSVTIQYMDNDWKIQCVTFKYFPSVQELFNSFDINICKLAYDGESVVYEQNVLSDIRSNSLKLNKDSINYPSVTLKRLVKYIKMGYNVLDEDLKILSQAFYSSKKKTIIIDMDIDANKIDGKDVNKDDYKNLSGSVSPTIPITLQSLPTGMPLSTIPPSALSAINAPLQINH